MCNCCVHVTVGHLGICCKIFKCWERWTLFWGLHSHNRATSIENCLFFFYIKDIQIWSDGKSCISSPMGRRFTMAKKHSYSINRTWSNFPEPVLFLILTFSCFYWCWKKSLGLWLPEFFLILQNNLPLILFNNIDSYHENVNIHSLV